MSPSTIHQQSARLHTLRFISGVHVLRSLGLGLGALMIGVVLHREHAGLLLECVLAFYGFGWPHVALLLAKRSERPMRVERTSLMIDSMIGGAWIALMNFNLLPSVVLATMLAMDCVGVGGRRLLLRGLLAQAIACGAAILVSGFHPTTVTTQPELLASLPLMMFYPLAVAAMANLLNRRVHNQNRLMARISSMDGLSELLNRSHWEEAVAGVLDNRKLDGRPASLLMIDIDHFKQINDYYGHVLGDDVIGRVGAIIRRSMREGDIAGRYGGDEFGVVLNGVNATMAAQIAERIRASVHAASFEQAEDLRCTLSIGIAEADERVANAREWIRQADAALYDAKMHGRNRLASATRNWAPDAHAA
ncbi:MAG TPA: diguanylate cyclase [Rhodanobacteraceae bacterium]|nr:diguanylate cyclase [Rhodanobacteraceae bacterium]